METWSGTNTNGTFMAQGVIMVQGVIMAHQVVEITIIVENMVVMSTEDMVTITGDKLVHYLTALQKTLTGIRLETTTQRETLVYHMDTHLLKTLIGIRLKTGCLQSIRCLKTRMWSLTTCLQSILLKLMMKSKNKLM